MRVAIPFPRPVPPQPQPPMADPARLEPVILVHGTFANRAHDGALDWWRPGSDYARQLDAALQAAGSAARCWAQLDPAGHSPFAWTGANTEGARRDAGRALAEQLSRLEADPSVARYHLVAHSHGGNVVTHALRDMAAAPAKLGTVVTMGTPALSFRHATPIDMRWVSVPLYVAALVGCLWVYGQAAPDQGHAWGVGAAVLAVALLAELFFARRRSRQRDGSLYGSGHAHAFVFAGDEAINGLRVAQDIARHPLRFVRQFASGSPAAEPAVRVTAAPQRRLADELAESGVGAVLDLLDKTPAVSSASGTVGVLGLPSTLPGRALPIDPGAGARIPAGVRSAFSVFETAAAAFPVRPVLQLGLWICLLLPRLALAAVVGSWTLLGLVIAFAVSWLQMLLAVLLAAWALPRLIRQGAFGADQGRFVGVSDLPPGVVRHEATSPELVAAAAAVGQRLGGSAGGSILGAIGAQDAFSIKAYVEKALGDAELTHSFYYRAPEVIARTATLVARTPLHHLPESPR